jgi:hypothetical protein
MSVGKSKPLQRSKKYLEDSGWSVCVVERYIKFGNMPFGKRIDAFNIGDLLACNPGNYPNVKLVALVQCCSTGHAKHKTKILGIPEAQIWKDSGGVILLHSWTKKGPRGKRKTWTLREEQI